MYELHLLIIPLKLIQLDQCSIIACGNQTDKLIWQLRYCTKIKVTYSIKVTDSIILAVLNLGPLGIIKFMS